MLIMSLSPLMYLFGILSGKASWDVWHIMSNISSDVFVERTVRKVIWRRIVELDWLVVLSIESGRRHMILVKMRVVDDVIRKRIH